MRLITKKLSEKIRDKVLEALGDRKGFDYWWDELDEDIQDEISGYLDQAIQEVLDDNLKGDT